ncbi:DUF1538 domain-containing protein [Treponema sp.]|uniref:DUF1538 domain-containing protein n=1 Tax=Treponema sp. TaxID=166 RepID=UPI003F0A7833
MDLFQKFKETFFSVFPIMVIVLFLSVTVAPLSLDIVLRFVAGGILVVVGLTFFLLGVDMGILPIGERSGAALTSKKNLALLLSASFLIGVMVTVAEPDVQVLADQIRNLAPSVNKWGLVFGIALGVGFFITIGLCRTVFSLKLRTVLIISYIVLFSLAFMCPKELQGAAFDAGGATTGPMTVPFIMALGLGVASVGHSASVKDGESSDKSFGLTGIASIGPIAAVCLYGMILNFFGADSSSCADSAEASAEHLQSGLAVFIEYLPEVVREVFMSMLPLVILFSLFQILLLKLPPVQIRKVAQGILYCFFGLVLFLVGAEGGFMSAGRMLGAVLGQAAFSQGGIWTVLIIAVSLLLGAITVCAEPAVWVLTEQVETVSGGNIRRKVILATLSLGVAASIALCMIRILYGFSLWYILIPGYAAALLLTFFSPPLFMGIAFDSGGVASGPMTSTFILSFTIGAASASGTESAAGAFGVIALVAMTPLIAIQVLGIIFKLKTRKKEVAQ